MKRNETGNQHWSLTPAEARGFTVAYLRRYFCHFYWWLLIGNLRTPAKQWKSVSAKCKSALQPCEVHIWSVSMLRRSCPLWMAVGRKTEGWRGVKGGKKGGQKKEKGKEKERYNEGVHLNYTKQAVSLTQTLQNTPCTWPTYPLICTLKIPLTVPLI